MKKRWASDVGFGLLVLAVGLLLTGVGVAFIPVAIPIGVAVALVGGSIVSFGGFEYFSSRNQ